MIEFFDVFIGAGITIFSSALLVISLLSYRRYRNVKLLFIGMILCVFLLRGILLSLSLFYVTIQPFTSSYSFGVLDLLVLVIIYLLTLKR